MLHTKFRDFQQSLKENFESEDLTPGLAGPEVVTPEEEAAIAALKTRGGGTIADDSHIDLTKHEGSLGSYMEDFMKRAERMSVPDIIVGFKEILAKVGATGQNRTAKRWEEWLRANPRPSHQKLLLLLGNLYLSAASLDVGGKGVRAGGRSRYDV